ncbi:MAG: hypothetical protein QNJ73_05505 [Gammaproteobacteria bacterium]|nr:hypothetical protein [Gammaproteobacteria bacterium]
MANNDLLKGALIGAAVIAIAPLVLSALSGRRNALGQGLARAGGVLAEKARETAAELAEVAEDVVADIQAEESVADTVEPPSPADVEPPASAAGGAG